MVNNINSAMATALFGGGSSSSTGVSADLLTAWASARAGIGVDVKALTQDPNAPLAPVWTPGISPSDEALVQRAFSSKPFFDTNAKLYSDLNATGDYKRLFALYSGLTTLNALAGNLENDKLSTTQRNQTLTQFSRGMSELQAFFQQQQFEDMRLAQGDRVDAAQTTLALPSKSEDYLTPVIHRGGLYEKVSGLAADAKFNIVATSAGGTVRNVAIDLSEMGSLPRTLSNVVSHINGKLSAAGASSRLETVDQTPKTTTIVLAGQPIERRYTGPRQYALKVDVRASERVSFEPVNANPAFYVVGDVAGGARLIKIEDVGDAAGQPIVLNRPASTGGAVAGDNVLGGWYGAGPPYTATPVDAYEQRSNALTTTGVSSFETALRTAGEAVLKLQFADGRTLSVSTAWRTGDQEAWRTRSGENDDQALLEDLSERLTQLLHEQGVAAGVGAWEDAGSGGLSILTGDLVTASSFTIGGKAVALDRVLPSGMDGGLRDGVYARRLEAAAVAPTGELFTGDQKFTFTTATGSQSITIVGGASGITGAQLATQLNAQLQSKGIAARASIVDDAGVQSLRVDALHSVTDVKGTINGESFDADLVAPGAGVSGGLPVASAGQPFGDAIRTFTAQGGSPLLAHTGALDLEIVVATPSGDKTINVSVSAAERLNDPDLAPGQWSATFQARVDAALNAAGVYVSGGGGLTQFSVAEGSGQRIASVSVNGDALTLEAQPTGNALGGGAFGAERSFTSAQAATGVNDDVAALLSDQNLSITFDTIWGQRTIGATLQPGDPRTLESAALRLNEALAAAGYDLSVDAVAHAGGGAGLRVVTGETHSVRDIAGISLGGQATAVTLDPIDVVAQADDPVGALRVSERASRGAAVIETTGASSPFSAPSGNSSAWFPGRAFDVSIGGGAKVATARAVATGADGSVYVLADLSGDSATSAIKGARDVALLKYDSAGKLQFTEMLGAAQSASGFSLAVAADGKVAIAGSVEGALSNSGAAKGGADSFVTLLDSNGKELWTQRRGATANDEVRAVAFAPDGSVIVAGKADSALGANLALGGADGYVRGFSAAGAELFTRQFGTGGADAATALHVRDDGAGGFDVFTGGVENNRGVLRRFGYSSGGGLTTGAVRDIGYFHNGAINALTSDNGALYVGGAVGADRLTLGAAAHASVAGQEGFVARLDDDLVSNGLDRASYVGSANDDSVSGIAVINGELYASGVTGGLLMGQGNAKAKSAFMARIDTDGAIGWSRTFLSAGGAIALNGLAVDTSGASALDVLGLPRGAIAQASSAPIASRSALRVGDEFQVGIQGRRLTTVRIGETDTLSSIVNAINRAMGSGGRAEIVREEGVERIKITARGEQAVRLQAGRDGRNALTGLGLTEGVVAENQQGGGLKMYGLGLIAADLKLDTAAGIKAAKAEISAAISIVRQAYEALLNPNADEMTDAEKALEARRKAAGVAPEYYSAQLANYQAALARLGG